MTGYLGTLRCPSCGLSRPDTERPFDPCLACRESGLHVNPFPVYELTRDQLRPLGDQPGIFRWRGALPIPAGEEVISLGEGNTPLLQLRNTGERLGLPHLYLKDESRNPTWSYKDRLISVAVSRARADGAHTLAVASTGNHGAAAAAYAAAAGLPCVVLTLTSVPDTMKTLMQSYGARVVALDKPSDRWSLLADGVRELGWVPLSGFLNPPAGSNPFGVDGYKTIAYEILADLGRAPTVVVVPTAYADGLTGIARGFDDLYRVGMIPNTPQLVAAEPFGPLKRALTDGFDPERSVPTHSTAAFSIASPVATFQGYDALRRHRGRALSTPEELLIRAQRQLASSEGIYAEASSVTTLVAIEELVGQGLIGTDDVVVAVSTSTGLKDVGATAAMLPQVPVVRPTLADLTDHLGSSGGVRP